MPALSPNELTTSLKGKDPKSLYFLYGEETFMIDEALGVFKEKVVGEGMADFNFNLFYAADSDVEPIIDAVETLPMMSPRRLVVVKEAQDFSAAELEKLTRLLENPVDSTTLVFVASKADMRKKFFKLFETKGVVTKFQKPFENQLAPWIAYIAKKHGKTLTPDATEVLKECVGANLADMNNELQKAAQYVGAQKTVIDVDDLKAVVSRTRIDTIFEFVNCIGSTSAADAFVHLAHLLDQGQNEVAVLAMITRHFRILLLCKEALKEGLSPSQIASRAGVPGFFIKEYLDQAKRLEMSHVLKVYDVLLDTDRALKSNPLASHIWLENLVLQSCKRANTDQRPAR